MEVFELRSIRFETEGSRAELMVFTADRAVETGVSDGGVDPTVAFVSQIGGTGVGVAHAEAGEENPAFVRLVVAVGILEEEDLGTIRADHAAVCEGERTWNG